MTTLIFGVAGTLVAAGAVWRIPSQYESRAVMAVTSADPARADRLARQVLSTANLDGR